MANGQRKHRKSKKWRDEDGSGCGDELLHWDHHVIYFGFLLRIVFSQTLWISLGFPERRRQKMLQLRGIFLFHQKTSIQHLSNFIDWMRIRKTMFSSDFRVQTSLQLVHSIQINGFWTYLITVRNLLKIAFQCSFSFFIQMSFDFHSAQWMQSIKWNDRYSLLESILSQVRVASFSFAPEQNAQHISKYFLDCTQTKMHSHKKGLLILFSSAWRSKAR